MKFKSDNSEIDNFEKKMSMVPKKINSVIAKTLNKQATDMKFEFVPQSLESNFTIRDKRFMNRQIKYNKAKLSRRPETNFSEVGSIEAGRFTGWEEQQTGKKPEKERTATIDIARSGDFSKKQRPSTRLKKGSFRRYTEYAGRSKKHKMFNMLRETRKQKLNFVINDGEGKTLNIPDGLYGWEGNELKMLQSFETPKAHKTDWMGDAINLMVKHRGNFDRVFERELEKVLKI